MYVRIRGKSVGPVEEAKVQELVRQGKVSRASEVSLDGESWVRASEIPSLFTSGPGEGNASASLESMLGNSKASLLPPEEQPEWFYSTDGRSGFGPLSRSEIGNLIRTGTLNPDSLVWKQGQMADTIRYTQDFAEFLHAPKPQSPGGNPAHLSAETAKSAPAPKNPVGEVPHPTSPPERNEGGRQNVENAASRDPSWKVIRQTLQLGPWVMFLAVLASVIVVSISFSLLGSLAFLSTREGSMFLKIITGTIVFVMIALMVRPLLALWKFQTGITTLATERTEEQLTEVIRRLHRLVRGFVIHIVVLVFLGGFFSVLLVFLLGWFTP